VHMQLVSWQAFASAHLCLPCYNDVVSGLCTRVVEHGHQSSAAGNQSRSVSIKVGQCPAKADTLLCLSMSPELIPLS
jgi:hypothetical protein